MRRRRRRGSLQLIGLRMDGAEVTEPANEHPTTASGHDKSITFPLNDSLTLKLLTPKSDTTKCRKPPSRVRRPVAAAKATWTLVSNRAV